MESKGMKLFEELGHPMSFKRGEYIYKQNQLLDDLRVFYILDGDVTLRRKYTALKSDELHYQKGDMFGILEVYLGKARITEAQCVTDVQLLGFNRVGVEKLMSSEMSVSLSIIRSLSAILRKVNHHIKELPA
ncbi:MAG: Crp/Fnr family transcriptional regulator [Leptonema sp. (in: Bacteria)]|nr:Crp/Fnr family transcriptional regulator [Leptonema sp. (in: bacteria)]